MLITVNSPNLVCQHWEEEEKVKCPNNFETVGRTTIWEQYSRIFGFAQGEFQTNATRASILELGNHLERSLLILCLFSFSGMIFVGTFPRVNLISSHHLHVDQLRP